MYKESQNQKGNPETTANEEKVPLHSDKIVLDIKLNAKDIWLLSMYNTNKGLLGLFNLVFTSASIYMLVRNFNNLEIPQKLLFVFFILLFTIIQPCLLYLKATKQAKNESIKSGFQIILDEGGFEVKQSGQNVKFEWNMVYKSMITKQMMIIFLNNVRAYLIPKRYWREHGERLRQLIKNKTRIRNFT